MGVSNEIKTWDFEIVLFLGIYFVSNDYRLIKDIRTMTSELLGVLLVSGSIPTSHLNWLII